jgi:hypothetical protein
MADQVDAEFDTITPDDIQQALENQTNMLLDDIENEVKNAKKYVGNSLEKFLDICRKVRNDIFEVQMSFIQSTKTKIDKALAISEDDTRQRKQVYVAWKLIFEHIFTRMQQIVAPLCTLLRYLAENDKRLERKYRRFYIGGGIALLCTSCVIGGVLIAHYIPTAVCAFAIVGATCVGAAACVLPLLIALGVSLLLVAGAFLLRGFWPKKVKNFFTRIYDQVKIWLVANSPMTNELDIIAPDVVKGDDKNNSTDAKLLNGLKRLLCTMELTEEHWLTNEALGTIKEIIEQNENRVKAAMENVNHRI